MKYKSILWSPWLLKSPDEKWLWHVRKRLPGFSGSRELWTRVQGVGNRMQGLQVQGLGLIMLRDALSVYSALVFGCWGSGVFGC